MGDTTKMWSKILFVVLLSLSFSSYHAQDINNVKKSLHERNLETEATLTKDQQTQLKKALERANIPIKLDELTPKEQKQLAERLGFSLLGYGVNMNLKPDISFVNGKLQLGNAWQFQAGAGVTASSGGSASNSASGSSSGSVSGSGSASGTGSTSGSSSSTGSGSGTVLTATNGSASPDYSSDNTGSSGSTSGSGSASGNVSVSAGPIASLFGQIIQFYVKVGKNVYNVISVVAQNVTHPFQTIKNIASKLGLNNTFSNVGNMASNMFGQYKNITLGLFNNGKGVLGNIMGMGKNMTINLMNFGTNTFKNTFSGIKNIVNNLLTSTSNILTNNPIKNIFVIFTNGTKGLIAKGIVFINNIQLNPLKWKWIQILFNIQQNVVSPYIINYWNTVLPQITNQIVQGILSVPNNTNQFLVVTSNQIIGITNTSANGVANYTQNFVATVPSNTQIAYAKYAPDGTLYLTTISNTTSGVVNSVYKLVNGTLTAVGTVNQGGGMAWNPAGNTMYVVDSGDNVIYSYNYSSESGATNQQVFYNASSNPQYSGTIKDVAVDQNGYVWALIQPSNSGGSVYLLKIDPVTGQVVGLQTTAFTSASSLSYDNGTITINGTFGSGGSASSNTSGEISGSFSYGGSFSFDGNASGSASNTGSFSFNT